jgi:3-keto-5-aminohexanoate cleavage enzyme
VSVVGGDLGRSEVATLALERGGHLHLGLEFYGGDRTPTNVELVEEAVALCEAAGRPVASCAEAAEILGLP